MPLWVLGLLVLLAALRSKDRVTVKPEPPRPPSRARHWVCTFVTVGVVGVLVWLPDKQNGDLPPRDFYLTVVQVIPVLMLAVALEGPVRRVLDRLPVVYMWQLMAVLVVSEVAALVSASAVLAASDAYVADHDLADSFLPGPNKKWSDLLSWVSIVGLAAGFVAVVGVALRPTQDRASR